MPWTSTDAYQHTHKANTLALQKMWAETANRVLKATGDDRRAIKIANSVVEKALARRQGR